MSKNKRAMAPILAVLIGLVGALAFLVGPAAAESSGEAWADDDSVASGEAFAQNGSVASGDAVAIDGSVASGCSTAIDDSTASGADCARKHHHDHHKAHKHAGPAKPVSSRLALTGSSTDGVATMALTALFAGALLVAVATSRRRHAAS